MHAVAVKSQYYSDALNQSKIVWMDNMQIVTAKTLTSFITRVPEVARKNMSCAGIKSFVDSVDLLNQLISPFVVHSLCWKSVERETSVVRVISRTGYNSTVVTTHCEKVHVVLQKGPTWSGY